MLCELIETEEFTQWADSLKDKRAYACVFNRLRRARRGNFGDCKPVAGGLYEMRIHYGPGFRIYYGQTGATLYIIVAGGTKQGQQKDIDQALALWLRIKGGEYEFRQG